MLGNLMATVLAGKNRDQVVDLLGEPASKMDPDGDGPNLSYPIGPERNSFAAIDYEWLIIEFDAASQYTHAYLATD